MSELRRNRPHGRLRPSHAIGVQVGVGDRHLLTVAVDGAFLTPHPIRETRVPSRMLGVRAGEGNLVARTELRQIEADARVDAPTPGLLNGAGEARDGDIMPEAGHLRRTPTLRDLDVGDGVGSAHAVVAIVEAQIGCVGAAPAAAEAWRLRL